ncbi:Lipase 3 [Psilocybe cubensis]|uniref:Lipase 3 n=2 Tax=Psilocybe cubensis TaxID=181762 RepID=A0ACB8GK04_PSICU|nr:Lipase 3 [Psilocybe cubensis]KAH9475727.1 Lipase 3 [Psilocybe cubensis]
MLSPWLDRRLWALFALASFGKASPAPPTVTSGPVVKLNYGSFQGQVSGNVETFLGMPFAAPPIGNLRFAPPQPPVKFKGIRQASNFGAACFQQSTNASALGPLAAIINELIANGSPGPAVVSEDCLFINVVKPANIPPGKTLPVLFWIYGGGFEAGDTSFNPGNTVVSRSIALGEPVIYVSANYRLSALGWLASKEVKEAGLGNAGLRDQRFAMQWVQDHIRFFGGDPKRVTIWGESAGAISVGSHLVINDGNPAGLFHGAVMESGSPVPMQDITSKQPVFDQLVASTGCTGQKDPIQCMRAVPFDKFAEAMNLTPNLFSFSSLAIPWQPTIDGEIIVRDPQVSIQKGLYAKVPLITGDCDDEGTLFSLSNGNITTNDEFLAYMQSNYFRGLISNDDLAAVGAAYPDDITAGSPFDTGTANAITPEFKRLAAVQGDLIFQAPRRFFLQTASTTQPTFAFLFKRGKATPLLGSFHGSDIPEFYGSGTAPDFIGTDGLVNFANTGNPSLPKNPISLLSAVDWQPWSSSKTSPPLLTFLDPAPAIAITADTFRATQMDLLTKLSLQLDSNQ